MVEDFMSQANSLAMQEPLNSTTQVNAGRSISINDIAHFASMVTNGEVKSFDATALKLEPSKAASSVVPPESNGFKSVMGAFDSMDGFAKKLALDTVEISKKGEMTPGDMLMLTVKCQQLLFQCELTSNVASRTSDGIQQLFRQQS